MTIYHGLYSNDASVKYGYKIWKDSTGKEFKVTSIYDTQSYTAEHALADYNWRDKKLVSSDLVEFVSTHGPSAFIVKGPLKA